MVLSKIVLSFFEMHIQINHLLNTIRHLLETFPESVLVESFDEKVGENVIKFINDSAKKEIAKGGRIGAPIETLDKEYCIRATEEGKNDFDNYNSLSQLLNNHCDIVKKEKKEAVSEVEVIPCIYSNESADESVISENSIFYRIKTVRVQWESLEDSFMHVFLDTTNVK